MAGLIAVFIGLSIWLGLYYTQTPAENTDQQLRPTDPLSQFLYSPVGNALMITVLQYVLANVVFWPALWLGQKIRGKDR